ncbi:MAG: 2-amino-4-hydroxy-6-hydroxymethyldihydropteridine diphosphokinase [Thermodesulfobacteriota bacterium]
MSLVYISIGSNLGDRIENCKKAIDEMGAFSKVVKVSSFYETEPVGKEDQPEFINLAAEIDTELPPYELLSELNKIEHKLGRERHEKWEPRIIDLDIIFYDDLLSKNDGLQIPHPRAHLRRFVLEPICEIDPEFVHPEYKLTVSELLKNINDDKAVIKIVD